MLLWSIIILIWVGLFAAINEHVLNYGVKDQTPFLSRVGEKGWYQAIALGLAVGLANYLASKGGWSILSLVLVVAALVYIAWWFFKTVSEWKEWILFVLMSIPVTIVLAAACAGVAEMIKSTFWVSVFMTLPAILSTAFGGFLLTRLMFVGYELTEKLFYKIARWVAWALTVVILIAQIIWGGINWGAIDWSWAKKTTEPEQTDSIVTEEPVETGNWWYFYNTAMIGDSDTKNDYNFGANPLDELALARVKNGVLTLKDISGKTEDELIALVSVEEIEKDFRTRLGYDPALGAGDMAWLDANTGTRYLGEFYDECKGEWASTINSAKVRWMKDQASYYRTLAAFFTFLDSAEKVEVVKVKSGLDDQMYMNPYTTDHIPDVIVMETLDHDGYFLRYTFNIKGEKITVAYRIDCGYQPTNVSKVMNIPAQTNPNKPTPTPAPTDPGKPSGGNPDPGKPSGGDPDPGKPSGGDPGKPGGGDPPSDPGGDGPYDPPYNKNPNQGTPVGGNDNPGPGPSTNNGVGAMYSSEENSNNSAFDTYEEYQQEMQELQEVNANQAVGGDPNTPSYTPPGTNNGGGTNVDSNAESGTGNGGIDAGTPTHNTNVDSNVGGSTSTSDDPVGTEWGGPPD